MKEETRGIIEKALDRLRFGFKENDIEAIQETTPLNNIEEFLLGYTIGYMRKTSEVIVLLDEGKISKTNEEKIRKIPLTRIPELRKKLILYLSK